MFGSSQDRARQLAGRSRRGRINSNGSSVSCRSISSSSHASQLCRTDSTLDILSQQPPVIEEHSTYYTGQSLNGKHTSQTASRTPASNTSMVPSTMYRASLHTSEAQRAHIGQHIFQAEYINHVLYGNPAVPVSTALQSKQFERSPDHNRYSSWGTLPATTQQVRNFTAPVPSSGPYGQQALLLPMCRDRPVLPPLEMAVFQSHLQPHTAVSLRGGHGYGSEASYAIQSKERTEDTCDTDLLDGNLRYRLARSRQSQLKPDWSLLSRPFTREFPWVARVFRRLQWTAPIFSGHSYDAFLDSLSETELDRFCSLFGPLSTDSFVGGKVGTARQVFFLILTSPQQQVFRNIITSRGLALLELNNYDSDTEQALPDAPPYNKTRPVAVLEYLLEATERPILLTQTKTLIPFSELPVGPLLPSVGRAVSTPNLRQQQSCSPLLTSQLYYASFIF